MAAPDPKTDLHRYLRTGREALLWKLEGLSEYDVRRPLVPTATNLLGLVKHGQVGYREGADNLPPGDKDWWDSYRARVEQAAKDAGAQS